MVIVGAPRTKKNHSTIVRSKGRPRLIPSEAYRRWESVAVPQMRIYWAGREPIARPVNVCAVFYRDADRGDAVGYYQALADALQKAGALVDDVWIKSWDGSRLAKDNKRPRVEVEIQEAA